MLRGLIVVIGVTSLIAAALPGEPGDAARPGASVPATAPAALPQTGIDIFPAPDNRPARAQLNRQIPSFEVKDQKFEEALAVLKRMTDLNIEVDWKGLEASGVDKDPKVSVSLKNVTIRDALTTLLAQVSSPTARVQFYVDRNIIHIHTNGDAVPVVFRIYDISDILLAERARWRVLHPPPATLPSTQPANFAGTDTENDISPERLVEDLTKLLMELVAPDTWRETGGMTGTMREFNGRLIIGTTEDIHERVEEVLAVLRKKENLPAARP